MPIFLHDTTQKPWTSYEEVQCSADVRERRLAHKTALEGILAGGKAYGAVLEAGVHCILTIDDVTALVDEVTLEAPLWDIINLVQSSKSHEGFEAIDGSTRSCWRAKTLPYGSQGYIVSRSGCEYLIQCLSANDNTPVDCYLRYRAEAMTAFLVRKPRVFVGEEAFVPEYNIPLNYDEVCNIIVPYRDRERNLQGLSEGLFAAVDYPYRIFAIEQTQDNPLFNRAKLCNTGFARLRKDTPGHWCFHDVDLIPESPSCDYSTPHLPTHMSRLNSQTNYVSTYDAAFGGVSLFTTEHFRRINGFSNLYWGWGLEDDDLLKRCNSAKLPTARRYGRYRSQWHTPKTDKPFVGTLQEKAEQVQESSPYWLQNYQRMKQWYDYQNEGLNSLTFSVLGERELFGVKVITVSI